MIIDPRLHIDYKGVPLGQYEFIGLFTITWPDLDNTVLDIVGNLNRNRFFKGCSDVGVLYGCEFVRLGLRAGIGISSSHFQLGQTISFLRLNINREGFTDNHFQLCYLVCTKCNATMTDRVGHFYSNRFRLVGLFGSHFNVKVCLSLVNTDCRFRHGFIAIQLCRVGKADRISFLQRSSQFRNFSLSVFVGHSSLLRSLINTVLEQYAIQRGIAAFNCYCEARWFTIRC